MKKFLLFNKESGSFISLVEPEGFNPEAIDSNLLLVKEVEMGENDFWYGDYETGRVYKGTDTVVISQQEVRDSAIRKIFSKYFFIDQIKIITDQLKTMVDSENQTQEFKDMVEFIDQVRSEYHAKKEIYSSNPEMYIWVTDEESRQQQEGRYKGFF